MRGSFQSGHLQFLSRGTAFLTFRYTHTPWDCVRAKRKRTTYAHLSYSLWPFNTYHSFTQLIVVWTHARARAHTHTHTQLYPVIVVWTRARAHPHPPTQSRTEWIQSSEVTLTCNSHCSLSNFFDDFSHKYISRRDLVLLSGRPLLNVIRTICFLHSSPLRLFFSTLTTNTL